MAKALEGVPWDEVRVKWEHGASPASLSAEYRVTQSLIRLRASRHGWASVRPSMTKSVIEKAAKRAVAKSVARAEAAIHKRVQYSVEQCVDQSIELGRAFMTQAKAKLATVEDGNLSAVASLGRTGVDIARKSLGLDATGSAGFSCAIDFRFVTRGDDAPLHAGPGHCVTVDIASATASDDGSNPRLSPD